jgi:hypothetical protein
LVNEKFNTMLADRGEGRVRFVPVNLLSVIQVQNKDLYHGGHRVHRGKAHRGILAGCGVVAGGRRKAVQ